ncbi:preprotein translocase subunit SecD [Castellaniella ginsengisoli]|uniref:Preprotein translocase subunit SecD n=1 Tax=Castellaniella ginsengisoli TaxID=546114 RepID=A0AB39CLA7_9BURK
MHVTTRFSAPFLLVFLLALAGCQNLPSASRTAPPGTPQTASGPTADATRIVQPVAIYLAQSAPGDQLVAVPVPEGTVYLHARPILAREDLTEAAALSDRQGGHFVGLRLTPAGAERLGSVSRQNIGGLLALVIGRELVAAPRISGTLDRGILAFEVPSAEVAADLAARIRGDAPQ